MDTSPRADRPVDSALRLRRAACGRGRTDPTRRLPLLALALALALVALHAVGYGDALSVARAGEMSDQEVLRTLTTEHPRDRAIRKALAWIKTQRNPDGSLATGKKLGCTMTSFGLMAHLAAGITFDDPRHGEWMRDSLRYVLAQQEPSGYFGGRDGSRMYGHGVTTLMLAEALGMIEDEELEEGVRAALERAAALTINAARVKKDKRHQGGWRYSPMAKDSDLSLSGWQLMSLHACQQVGITVPESVIENAVDYARRLTEKDGRVGYQKRGDDRPALRGLGLLCFAIAREEEEEIADRIGGRIEGDPLTWKGPFFFYRSYYDAVGMARARPERWARYGPKLQQVLIEHQRDDGSWPSPPGDNESRHGRVYIVSMAVLALAVDRYVLPAYQR